MRIVIIYRPGSETSRKVEEYIADFERFHPGARLESLDYDSLEGTQMARNYGIMEHPSVIAIKDDGQMEQMWQGVDKIPLMNDLAYYAQR